MKSCLKRKNFFVVVLCAAVLCLAAGVANCGTYGGGTGEPNNPFLIYDANHMNAIGANPGDWDKYFELMTDIDLGGYTGSEFNIIGKFRGVFDGNGHTICNFTYSTNSGSYVGIFGCVDGDTAVIRNLGLIDPYVSAKHPMLEGGVGSLVGLLKKGVISGCWSERGQVIGDWRIGGLVGSNWNGMIFDSYSCSNATDYGGFLNGHTGGLVGDNSGKIYNCYSTGAVTGGYRRGGLVGANGGSVLNSFWDIQSSGQTTSAGGVGKTTAQMQDPNTFLNAGWDFVGEYKNGPSDIWAAPVGGRYMVLWWQLSPLPVLPSFSGGTGEPNDPYLILTASDLNKIGYNPRLMKAHFKLVDDIDLTGLRFFNIANAGNPFMGVFDGNGHTISNFSYHSNGIDCIGLFAYIDGSNAQIKDLGLINPDIDAGTGDWVGSMVGQIRDGAITGCWCDRCGVSGHDSVGGLVGFTYHANISNSYSNGSVSGRTHIGGLVGGNLNGDITGSYSSATVAGGGAAGGLVGTNGLGEMNNSYSTGSVSAQMYYDAGGLVGRNYRGTISNSCSSATVVGVSYVGGLVGRSDNGDISNSYSTGSIEGDDEVGGLVGANNGMVTNCYSTGKVLGDEEVGGLVGVKFINGTVTDSFWDVNTSGMNTSDGGTAKTTAEMQTKSTFTLAGWDFTTPVWTIAEGVNYPRLWWENTTPIACIVGGDQIFECEGCWGRRVTLDGSCSGDLDSTPGTNDDIVYFDWYEQIDPCDPNSDIFLGSGEIIDCNLSLGEHDIILEVIDKAGAFDTNEVTIIVEDTTLPEFSLAVSPDVLWPPSHKMVEIPPSWEVSDNCDESPQVTLVSITMNEDDDEKGDGHTSGDIQVKPDGSIWLRAERSGKGSGRVYTITYQAVDDAGNVVVDSATVTVPHDRR